MTAAMRSSATIAAEDDALRAKQSELEQRRVTVYADRTRLRDERAESLVSGAAGPSLKALALLTEEEPALNDALEKIAFRRKVLKTEAEQSGIAEAKAACRAALPVAVQAVAALDTALRSAFDSTISPAFDAYGIAMKTARDVENTLDRLERQASAEELPPARHPSDAAIHRRGALLALVADVRRYATEVPQ